MQELHNTQESKDTIENDVNKWNLFNHYINESNNLSNECN